MRNTYLVTYDISDPKRLRRVFRIMRGFGDAVQLSVFRCQLSRRERILLLERLSEVIHHQADQVMVVDLGPSDGRADIAVEVLGRSQELPIRHAVIV
jgi:CRISPR-associated protein Cas2